MIKILTLRVVAGITTVLFATFASAQVSTYYATQGTIEEGLTWVYQGGAQQFDYSWTSIGQMIIYVNGTIHQAAYGGNGAQGMEYTLGGQMSGNANNWFNDGNQAFDGATNGKNVFTVDFLSGAVKAWGMNFEGPGTVLFHANVLDMGITYDSKRNEIWTTNWRTGNLDEWSFGGQLLSETNMTYSELAALAYDPADDSLWMKDNMSDRLLQVSASNHTIMSSRTNYAILYGGEIAGTNAPVPEPATMAVFAMGIGTLLRKRRA